MSDPTWERYRLQQKLFSIGEDFWIENAREEHVYRVDGKVLQLRETFVLEDATGTELATIQAKLLTLRPTMEIERHGELLATIQKSLFSMFREHYTIEVTGGPTLEAQGNFTGHQYEVTEGGRLVAEVSRQWFTLRDSYGVAIAPDQDVPLLLSAVVCLDEMSERAREQRRGGLAF